MTDDDEIIVRTWQELDEEPDREMLVDDILFSAGVTTIVGKPGMGKTTFAVPLAMTVQSGGIWAGKLIKPRPVLWVAGDDKYSLKSMRKVWIKENPKAKLMAGGGWIDGPIPFSDKEKTRELISWLRGKPPMLIVLDMVADCFGGLDDEKGKDAIRVYGNIWLVVRETGASFFGLQHTPWRDLTRGKGSIAIPGKNDIVLVINELNLDKGYIKVGHQKRREGPKRELAFETKLVPLAGKPQPVPMVTGVDATATIILGEDLAAAEGHARDLVQIVVEQTPPESNNTVVPYKELLKLSGKSPTTFKRARTEAVDVKGWLVGVRGGYQLNPDGSWKEALIGSSRKAQGPPHRGVDPLDPEDLGPLDPIGPKLDPGPYVEEEPPSKPVENELELKKAAALLKIVSK